ncbi:hypothetical protein ACE1MS_23425 (plasmid) [Lysinibacillus sp. fkY74-1]
MEKGKNFQPQPDELIEELVGNKSLPPDVKTLVGFLGQSDCAEYWRLYLTLELNEFLEIPTDDIIYSQSLKTDHNPLGGSLVWVKNDSKIRHARLTPLQAQLDFLKGGIMNSFLNNTNTSEIIAREVIKPKNMGITIHTDHCT